MNLSPRTELAGPPRVSPGRGSHGICPQEYSRPIRAVVGLGVRKETDEDGTGKTTTATARTDDGARTRDTPARILPARPSWRWAVRTERNRRDNNRRTAAGRHGQRGSGHGPRGNEAAGTARVGPPCSDTPGGGEAGVGCEFGGKWARRSLPQQRQVTTLCGGFFQQSNSLKGEQMDEQPSGTEPTETPSVEDVSKTDLMHAARILSDAGTRDPEELEGTGEKIEAIRDGIRAANGIFAKREAFLQDKFDGTKVAPSGKLLQRQSIVKGSFWHFLLGHSHGQKGKNKKLSVEIECQGEGCDATRRVYTSDLHQTRLCESCKKKETSGGTKSPVSVSSAYEALGLTSQAKLVAKAKAAEVAAVDLDDGEGPDDELDINTDVTGEEDA